MLGETPNQLSKVYEAFSIRSRDFFSSEMNGTVEKIGELSVFHAERLGIGRFGTAVFIGKYNEGIAAEDVAVKMMENGKIWIDSSLYLKANGQPNVIKYYGTHETHPKLTYLAIELCIGTLEDLVCGSYEDDFAMTDESYLPILHQITAGLNQLHSLGIVHGNLKPSNILVSFPKGDGTEPTMKLADFGIRHAVRNEANEGITHFRLVTTEGWMCPFDMQDPVDSSFDLFSLGCVCGFIALNGLHPFGTDPISRIRNRQPMTLTLSQMNVILQYHAFFDLIVQMLNFDASKRPSTADALNCLEFYQKQAVAVASLFLCDCSQIPELVPAYPPSSSPATTQQSYGAVTAPPVLQETLDFKESQIVDFSFGIEPDSDREELTDSGYVSESNSGSSSLPPKKKNKTDSLINPTNQSWHVEPIEDRNNPSSPSDGKKKICIRFTIKPKQNFNCSTLTSHLSSALQKSPVSPSNNKESNDGQSITLDKLLSCDICDYECDVTSKLRHHRLTHARPFKCEICSKTFTTSRSVVVHRKVHSPPQFKCDFCPKMFTFKSNKTSHMNSHTRERTYDCDECHKQFYFPISLAKHRKTHSDRIDQQSNDKSTNQSTGM